MGSRADSGPKAESYVYLTSVSVNIYLEKEVREPCWKFLLAKKIAVPSWLSRDLTEWKADECQMEKEAWRETYFKSKLMGVDPLDVQMPQADQTIQAVQSENVISKFRKLAVPYR